MREGSCEEHYCHLSTCKDDRDRIVVPGVAVKPHGYPRGVIAAHDAAPTRLPAPPGGASTFGRVGGKLQAVSLYNCGRAACISSACWVVACVSCSKLQIREISQISICCRLAARQLVAAAARQVVDVHTSCSATSTMVRTARLWFDDSDECRNQLDLSSYEELEAHLGKFSSTG